MKKPSISKLKKKAWRVFSEYIRRKGGDWDFCYTCEAKFYWKQLQCGHLLDGRNNAILFCEDAVRKQCAGCNLFKSGNKEVFIPKFIDEMGRAKYEELRRLKRTTVKYSISDLEELIAKYQKLLEAL